MTTVATNREQKDWLAAAHDPETGARAREDAEKALTSTRGRIEDLEALGEDEAPYVEAQLEHLRGQADRLEAEVKQHTLWPKIEEVNRSIADYEARLANAEMQLRDATLSRDAEKNSIRKRGFARAAERLEALVAEAREKIDALDLHRRELLAEYQGVESPLAADDRFASSLEDLKVLT